MRHTDPLTTRILVLRNPSVVYWLAELCVRRPVFALMLIMALVVAGVAAFPQLGVDRYPEHGPAHASTSARSIPARPPQEVESEVSQVLEDAVATVAGIDELRSISSDGMSIVMVTFNLNRNLDAGGAGRARRRRRACSTACRRGSIRRSCKSRTPIRRRSSRWPSPGRGTPSELYLLADRYVKNVIESAPGVGQVTIAGAADRAVQVEYRRPPAGRLSAVDPAGPRRPGRGRTPKFPAAASMKGSRERSLRTLGRVPHAREFPDLVVATVGGTPVRLQRPGRGRATPPRKSARWPASTASRRSCCRCSGNRAKTRSASSKASRAACRSSRGLLPDDVEVTVIQDQSRYILAALHEIEGHLIVGSILASVTVLLFMRSWRSTLIAAVAIPASIIATFAFMKLFGFTLNNVTMLALVLMVGVVIDDAIVVLENVFHCIEEKGHGPRRRRRSRGRARSARPCWRRRSRW